MQRPPRRRLISVNRWPAWATVILFWAGFAAAVGLTAPLSSAFPGLWKGAFLGGVASLATVFLTAWVVRISDGNAGDIGHLVARGSFGRFILGFGFGLFLIASHILLLWWFGGQVSFQRVAEVRPSAFVAAMGSFIPLAAMEELGFRGFPLQRLRSTYGLWLAQALVALAFAAYHVVGGFPWVSALLGTGMGSVMFGMAAIATRGLAVPVGLHAAWNLGGWAVGEKQDPGYWKIVVDESSRTSAEIAGTLGYFGVTATATLGFWLLHRHRSRTRGQRGSRTGDLGGAPGDG